MFTPEPWIINENSRIIMDQSNEKGICFIFDDLADDNRSMDNARLISQAPNMFNVLKDILNKIDGWADDGEVCREAILNNIEKIDQIIQFIEAGY
jgi:hypothetical protein